MTQALCISPDKLFLRTIPLGLYYSGMNIVQKNHCLHLLVYVIRPHFLSVVWGSSNKKYAHAVTGGKLTAERLANRPFLPNILDTQIHNKGPKNLPVALKAIAKTVERREAWFYGRRVDFLCRKSVFRITLYTQMHPGHKAFIHYWYKTMECHVSKTF